jgi:hypoxanthine phosphoribosyltransferase
VESFAENSFLIIGGASLKELLSTSELDRGVAELARQISERYGQRPLTIIGILTGSIVLLADLIRLLEMPLRVGVVQASSYRGNTTRGELTINADLMPDIRGRDVLLIDDIFDTGHTLATVTELIRQHGAESVCSAVLLRKHGRQEIAWTPDFVGFDIPDKFVVGYGLDYQDAYRNLSYIAALDPEDLVESPA